MVLALDSPQLGQFTLGAPFKYGATTG